MWEAVGGGGDGGVMSNGWMKHSGVGAWSCLEGGLVDYTQTHTHIMQVPGTL